MTADEKLRSFQAEAEGPRCLSTEGLGRGSVLYSPRPFFTAMPLTTIKRENKAMPTDIGNMHLSAHLNASQCALNEKDWPGACAYATRALKCVRDEREGLYRRGVAGADAHGRRVVLNRRVDLKQATRRLLRRTRPCEAPGAI